MNLYDHVVETIDGRSQSLQEYHSKVLLIVNVASKCGFTPQYAGLEALYQRYHSSGFQALGFPCNQFGWQEPGSNEEIQSFCSLKYGVTFPLFAKLRVKGSGQHPLFASLTGPDSPFPGAIRWNFHKFLVSREGILLARFGSRVSPESPQLIGAIEDALHGSNTVYEKE